MRTHLAICSGSDIIVVIEYHMRTDSFLVLLLKISNSWTVKLTKLANNQIIYRLSWIGQLFCYGS